MNINFKPLWEGLKEVGRLAFLAVISVVVVYLSNRLTGLDAGSLEAIGITVALRFLDKVVHEDDRIDLKGVAPF